MKHIFKDKGMIITGDHGSGKTTLAKIIAKACGSYCFMDSGAALEGTFELGDVLSQSPDVVIVDEIKGDFKKFIKKAKYLTSAEYLPMHRRGVDSELVPNVKWIFCTCDRNPLNIDADSRRFMIIDLKGEQ